MVMDINKAVRAAIESRYDGKCIITEHQKTIDPDTHITGFSEVEIGSFRCHLSYKSSPNAQDGQQAEIKQTIKLFLAPEIRIKPGSKITVIQNGRQEEYQGSGVPAVYTSHQEIQLELFKGWA